MAAKKTSDSSYFIYAVLKEVDVLFASHEWEHCESAVLVLGAIAQGISLPFTEMLTFFLGVLFSDEISIKLVF